MKPNHSTKTNNSYSKFKMCFLKSYRSRKIRAGERVATGDQEQSYFFLYLVWDSGCLETGLSRLGEYQWFKGHGSNSRSRSMTQAFNFQLGRGNARYAKICY